MIIKNLDYEHLKYFNKSIIFITHNITVGLLLFLIGIFSSKIKAYKGLGYLSKAIGYAYGLFNLNFNKYDLDEYLKKLDKND